MPELWKANYTWSVLVSMERQSFFFCYFCLKRNTIVIKGSAAEKEGKRENTMVEG
jgi:hypothetical protein